MQLKAFSASGNSFSVHEGNGPATLHVHHPDDEAWHVLDGELTFRCTDRTESVGPGRPPGSGVNERYRPITTLLFRDASISGKRIGQGEFKCVSYNGF
jgi:hypothetical protein